MSNVVTVRLSEYMDGMPVAGAEFEVGPLQIKREYFISVQDTETGEIKNRMRTLDGPQVRPRPLTQGVSGPDGVFTCEFQSDDVYDQQSGMPLQVGEEKVLPRVFGVLLRPLHVKCAGLEEDITFSGMTELSKGQNLSKDLVLDFAKSIVGATTSNSVTLWFCHHGSVGPADLYVCEIDEIPDEPGEVTLTPFAHSPVDFGPEPAVTAVVRFDNLKRSRTYDYRLHLREGTDDTPGSGRVLANGRFTTAPADDADRFSLVFGSCHTVNQDSDLERWRELAARTDYDLLLLIGDQIYEYGLDVPKDAPNRQDAWFAQYVKRYHQYWVHKPMREVLRRTPTYMTLDDHEIKDDFGTLKFDPAEQPIEGAQENGAIRAYHFFQHSHNPGGAQEEFVTGTSHYHFRWGPAAFFVSDSRLGRQPEDEAGHPILGEEQFEAFERWCRDPETEKADVIFFVAAVPLALVSVPELERISEEVGEGFEQAVGSVAAIVGALAVGALGALAGYSIGKRIGAEIFDRVISEDDLRTEYDINDQWTAGGNRGELKSVLDLLFDLANRGLRDAPNERRHPRAVFVLSGDSHLGAMHLIGKEEGTEPNRLIYQLISSPISRQPPLEKFFKKYQDAIPKEVRSGSSVLDGLFAQDIQDNLDRAGIRFPLDDEDPPEYKAQLLGIRPMRNFGRIGVERLGGEGRVYRFRLGINGEAAKLLWDVEVDLEVIRKPVS